MSVDEENQPKSTDNVVLPANVAAAHSMSEARHVPRVAIVGVHGVGAHAAGASENAMADLLFSLPADQPLAARFFGFFREVGVQIPLQRV